MNLTTSRDPTDVAREILDICGNVGQALELVDARESCQRDPAKREFWHAVGVKVLHFALVLKALRAPLTTAAPA